MIRGVLVFGTAPRAVFELPQKAALGQFKSNRISKKRELPQIFASRE
jgi:hypothetical protein